MLGADYQHLDLYSFCKEQNQGRDQYQQQHVEEQQQQHHHHDLGHDLYHALYHGHQGQGQDQGEGQGEGEGHRKLKEHGDLQEQKYDYNVIIGM